MSGRITLPVQWKHLEEWLKLPGWEAELLGTDLVKREEPHLLPDLLPYLLELASDPKSSVDDVALLKTLIRGTLRHGQFTSIQVVNLVPEVLRLRRESPASSFVRGPSASEMLVGLFHSPLQVSLAGTLARVLWFHGDSQRLPLVQALRPNLLASPTLPVEVMARVLHGWSGPQEFGDYITNTGEQTAQRSLLEKRMREAYPEFTDLPADLLTAVVASQPIPPGWFMDVWRLPSSPSVLPAPQGRITDEIPWDELFPETGEVLP